LSEHLTAVELEFLLSKELPPQRMGEIRSHLAQGCQLCRTMLGRAYGPSQTPLTPEEEAEYERVITSVTEFVVRSEGRLKQGDPVVRVASIIEAAGVEHVFTHEDRTLHTYKELLERSWALRHDKPREMVELAKTAVHVAQNLDPTILGSQKVADCQARAWGELGNAYRAADEHWEAQRAFGKAFQLLSEGTDDLRLRAHLHDLQSSLLGDQRKFALAFDSLEVTINMYRRIGDQHSVGRAMIKKAIYTHYSGRSEDALVINTQALAMIDEQRDPYLPVVALQNRLTFLVACGHYKDAKVFLFKNRTRISEGGRILATKVRWLEGQISYGTADYPIAESTFQEVKQVFVAEGLGFAAALASLEIAMSQMRLGRYGEAEEVTIKAASVFAALNIHREVLGAVGLLRDAFLYDKATINLIEHVVSFIHRWEINPEARFLPPSDND
jgi:tetratricopeptide (TPR) repeat protein